MTHAGAAADNAPRPDEAVFIAALPCARCAIQRGEIAPAGAAKTTPWGLIPGCKDHIASAGDPFGWEKLSTDIETLGADLARAARRGDRAIARHAYERQRRRALSLPDGAEVRFIERKPGA